MNKKSKLYLYISVSLISGYVLGVILFMFYTFPNTFINGVNKSFISIDDVFNIKYDRDFKIKLNGRSGKSLEIIAGDINFTNSIKGKPNFSQNPVFWPVHILKNNDYKYDVDLNYNNANLEKILRNSILFKDIVSPKDAEIIYNGDKYIISDEVLGDLLDFNLLKNEVLNAFLSKTEVLDLNDFYKKPQILKNDKELLKKVNELNNNANKKYIFDFKDRKFALEGKKLLDVLDFIDNKYVINENKLKDFVAEIAKKTDTYRTERKFKATGIGEIKVPGGIYGWQMNVSKTVKNIVFMFNEGKNGNVKIEYNLEGLSRATNDIGDTYIEVDLSRQHMWFYKNGKLFIDTPVVTGHGTQRWAATPVGVNKVWSKERNVKLKGNNAVTGEPYTYPVEYWMPIGWTGSGIHDTSTRKSYGGDIYLYGGSSSCINTPPNIVEIIYNNVDINTPVVTYESSTNYSPTEFEKQDWIKVNPDVIQPAPPKKPDIVNPQPKPEEQKKPEPQNKPEEQKKPDQPQNTPQGAVDNSTQNSSQSAPQGVTEDNNVSPKP